MNDSNLKETLKRGDSSFPLCLYTIHGCGKQVLPYHWHDEFEIFYLRRGECTVRIGNFTYPVTCGDFVFVNSGEIHSAYRGNEQECIYDSIVFDLSMFRCLVPDECQRLTNSLSTLKLTVPHILPESPYRSEIGCVIEETIRRLTEKKPGYKICVKGSLYRIFALMTESKNLKNNKGGKTALGKYEEVIKESMDYISLHYQNKIYLEELADQVRMSKFAFCKCFKQYMGVTPMEYINILRINNAYLLLSTGRENVTGAAIQCGFDNMSYFARTFKKYKGFSPSRAMKQR